MLLAGYFGGLIDSVISRWVDLVYAMPALLVAIVVAIGVQVTIVERLGDPGRRLHTGRSRNEQVSLDLRLYLRRRIPIVQHAIAALIEVLANQAAEEFKQKNVKGVILDMRGDPGGR